MTTTGQQVGKAGRISRLSAMGSVKKAAPLGRVVDDTGLSAVGRTSAAVTPWSGGFLPCRVVQRIQDPSESFTVGADAHGPAGTPCACAFVAIDVRATPRANVFSVHRRALKG